MALFKSGTGRSSGAFKLEGTPAATNTGKKADEVQVKKVTDAPTFADIVREKLSENSTLSAILISMQTRLARESKELSNEILATQLSKEGVEAFVKRHGTLEEKTLFARISPDTKTIEAETAPKEIEQGVRERITHHLDNAVNFLRRRT